MSMSYSGDYVSDSDGGKLRPSSAVMRNRIINGGFDIWQRGTSIASSGSTYTADRWYLLRDGNATGSTCSRVTATNTNFLYGAKVQRDSGNTGTGNLYFAQPFETNNIVSLRGSYVTVSFNIKAGANFSGSNLKVYLVSGTGTNSKYWGGGFTSATALINGTTFSISTTQSYQTVTTSAVVPTNATQLELSFVYTPTGTAGADDSFTIEGIQVEKGTVATDFEYRQYQQELSLCQRYYAKINSLDGNTACGAGVARSSTASNVFIKMPTTMRTNPTVSYSNVYLNYNSDVYQAVTGNSGVQGGTDSVNYSPNSSTAGMTTGYPVLLTISSGGSGGYVDFSAEL